MVFVVFDVLYQGELTLRLPYLERRRRLEALGGGEAWHVAESYEDGGALWRRVCERGLEGVVAKKLSGAYLPGRCVWVKVKNQHYWRWPLEREVAMHGWSR
ncbi:MAG: bifunctional non-ous end joining protein LigD [Gaiellales bacterium]|nr:bifunctional non-ous end joining protein LigD [Gaiellales bacterium]